MPANAKTALKLPGMLSKKKGKKKGMGSFAANLMANINRKPKGKGPMMKPRPQAPKRAPNISALNRKRKQPTPSAGALDGDASKLRPSKQTVPAHGLTAPTAFGATATTAAMTPAVAAAAVTPVDTKPLLSLSDEEELAEETRETDKRVAAAKDFQFSTLHRDPRKKAPQSGKLTLFGMLKDRVSGKASETFLERAKQRKEARVLLKIRKKKAEEDGVMEPELTEEDLMLQHEERKRAEEAAAKAVEEAKKKQLVPQVRIVNGEVVVNTESLMIVQPEAPSVRLEVVREQRARVTSASYGRRVATDKWKYADTQLFYRCLSQYGTDFSFIVQQFPGRTRKQLKAKFKREERANLHLVELALKNELPVDVESFRQSMHTKERVEAARAVLRETQKTRT